MGLIFLTLVLVLLFGGLGIFVAKVFLFGRLLLLIVPFFPGRRTGYGHI